MRISPTGPLVASAVELEISAATAGLGVVCSFEEFLAPAFASGALVPILEDWWQSFSGPFLYYASRRHMTAPLRAFVDYLKLLARLEQEGQKPKLAVKRTRTTSRRSRKQD